MTLVHAETGEKVTLSGVHPVADLFPLLEGDDFQALADDIAAQGLLHPVTLTAEGVLLDGRNRLAAAKLAKAAVTCTVYEGDAVAFILSVNMARRDMTKGQKAMVAAQAGDLSQISTRQLERITGINQSRFVYASTVLQFAPTLAGSVVAGRQSLDDAYKVAQANKAAAQKADTVLAELEADAPDLAAKVAEGTLTLGEAKTLHDRRIKEEHEARIDRTRTFSDSVIQLGALLDYDDPAAVAAVLVDGWEPKAVRMIDAKEWLTPAGLQRVAHCLDLVSTLMEANRG